MAIVNRSVFIRIVLLLILAATLIWAVFEHRNRFVRAQWLQQAETALEQGELEQAQSLARAALNQSPLRGRAYRVLAQAAEKAGDEAQAAQLHALAVRFQSRDLPSRQWLAARALASADIATALEHYDHMLRIRPALAEAIFPLLTAFVDQGLAPALVPVLAADPPWRGGFLARVAQDANGSERLHALFLPLAKAPVPLTERERTAYLERLLRDQRFTEAYLAWVGFLPASQQEQIGNIFDGGFEQPPEDAGFGWRVGRADGARIARVFTPGAGGERALWVSFGNRRVPFAHVRQLLALGPGRYRFQGRARLDDLRNERGLRWRLHCAQGDQQTLAETERLHGNQPWQPFQTEFKVPAEACQGQWLKLELTARIPAEQRISGSAWYDDLRIIRIDKPD